MSIKFTQFLRPDGRPVPTEIDMPIDIENMAKKLNEQGYRFEIEELSTGEVHMDCSKGKEEPVALELCENGPAVVAAVERLVRRSYSKAFVEFYDEDEDPEQFWRKEN